MKNKRYLKVISLLLLICTLLSMCTIVANAKSTIKTITIKYNDIYKISTDFKGFLAVKADNVKVLSTRVINGKNTAIKDKRVVKVYSSGKKILATGVGTAKLTLVKSEDYKKYQKGKKVSTKKVNVTVDPAKLTIVYIAGQSNAEGLCSKNTGYKRKDSVLCSRTDIFSSFYSCGYNRSKNITGIKNLFSYDNEESFTPSSLSYSTKTTINGKTLKYPLYALSSSGKGKTGIDSAFAYEWNKITGQKVYVVNAAYAGTKIKWWTKGHKAYEHAKTSFLLAKGVYDAEIKSGHYTKGKRLMLFMQGEYDSTNSYSTYKKYFDKFYKYFNDTLKLNALGIIIHRSSLSLNGKNYHLYLTGARKYQINVSRDTSNNIFMASTVNESWTTDERVYTYFNNKYGEALDYPLRSTSSYIGKIPVSVAEVKNDIHFSQIGHNENGIDAAINLYRGMRKKTPITSYYFKDTYGKDLSEDKSLIVTQGTRFSLSARATNSFMLKGVTYSYSKTYFNYDSNKNEYIPILPGFTKIKINKDGNTEYTQKITVYAKEPMISSCTEVEDTNNLSITFDLQKGISKYMILYKKSTDSKYVQAGISDTNTFVLEDLQRDTEYNFAIRCMDNDNNFLSTDDFVGYTYYFGAPVIESTEETVETEVVNIEN